ncbi:hypothetical protein F5890DRAFT_1488165 [Lentinula detonsa]|uniref:Uncharacterized protein n=1 Tax=Lentinula detonsa TaxID=2804962 RepID=A0AA38Q895_9AGAR|nr:hypothetical protein F5890DRAFT_1488165 [Lentinula detonsa]
MTQGIEYSTTLATQHSQDLPFHSHVDTSTRSTSPRRVTARMSATRTISAQTQNPKVDDLISHLPVHTSPLSTSTNSPSSASRPSQGHRAPPSSTNRIVYEQTPRSTGRPASSRSVSMNITNELPRHCVVSPEPHQLNVGSETGSRESTRTRRPVQQHHQVDEQYHKWKRTLA